MLERPENRNLPDVASEKPTTLSFTGALDWVGMKGIEMPILLQNQEGPVYRTAARVNAFVSLDSSSSRGIHMSRLFKELQDQLASHVLTGALLAKILGHFLQSHQALSEKAKIEVQFQALVERKALLSPNKGWRTYPVRLCAWLEASGQPRFFVETLVTYSSTCPASAALSRQLIQENFQNQFSPSSLTDFSFEKVSEFLASPASLVATPHAQRSHARLKVEWSTEDLASTTAYEILINKVEEALGTAVQTVVKREDEQEFARRNASNLMFCEDAARRVQMALLQIPQVIDFIAEMSHLESLHPHNAVATVSRGLELQSFDGEVFNGFEQ